MAPAEAGASSAELDSVDNDGSTFSCMQQQLLTTPPPTPSANDDDGYVPMVGLHFEARRSEMQALEICDEPQDESESYNFRRSARRSVLLRLGEVQGSDMEGLADIFDPYWKTSDKISMMTYISIIVSAGTFSLSRAVAKCGFIPGFFAIVGFSCLQTFLAFRVVEMPQFLKQNVENTGGIAKLLMSRNCAVAYALLSIVAWWSMCSTEFDNIMDFIDVLMNRDGSSVFYLTTVRWVSAGLIVPFVVGTGVLGRSRGCSGQDLQKVSVYSCYAMFAVGAIELICAISHGLAEPDSHYIWVGKAKQIKSGILDMIPAFYGIAILPHLVADMLHPQNAKKIIAKASVWICAFYVSVGIGCYFGWGNTVKRMRPLKRMFLLGSQYQNAAYVISILVVVKTVLTFPIMFVPLCREVEAMLDVQNSPALALRLPWALRQQQNKRRMLRIVLLIMTMLPSLMTERARLIMRGFSTHVPLILIHFTLPIVLAFVALLVHQRLSCQQGAGGGMAGAREPYMCSNFYVHLLITFLTALFMTIFTTFNMGYWILDFISIQWHRS